MHKPKDSITAKESKYLLTLGQTLSNVSVKGILEIATIECNWEQEVIIDNCIIENLRCINVMFHKKVTIKNSILKEASFNFSYFFGGLTINNCIFESYLDFEAGGHNNPGNLYLIKNSGFEKFVNFNDCWFTGNVAILNNIFHNGTNIDSKEQYITIDGTLLLENNVGRIDVDDDCR